jgi:hypothetical protein
MKSLHIYILFLFACISIKLNAQEFNCGLNANLMSFKINGVTNNGSKELPNYDVEEISLAVINLQANVGFDYQPIQFKEGKMSVGLNSNLALGYLINPSYEGLNGALTIDLPQYVAFRYGKRATKDNMEPFGIGIGFGYNYQFIPFPDGAVAMFLDFSFRETWFVKLSCDLKKRYMYDYYSSEGYIPNFEYRQIGIQIGYTL